MARVGKRVLVFDLARARLAYLGALVLTRLLPMDPMTRHDAPASVRRAYTAPELRELAERAGLRGASVVDALSPSGWRSSARGAAEFTQRVIAAISEATPDVQRHDSPTMSRSSALARLGSASAMHLARAGWRVALVDRAPSPATSPAPSS